LTDLTPNTSGLYRSKATRRAKERPRISLADGEFLEPRRNWAEAVGISDKTAGRMNLPTTYIGGVAYVLHNASREILAERVQRRNVPQQRRRAR